MNRLSRQNMAEIKRLVSEGTGTELSLKVSAKPHLTGVLIIVLILILGSVTAFAIHQFRISRDLLSAQENEAIVSGPEDPGIYDQDGDPVYQVAEGSYSKAAPYSGPEFGDVNDFVISYPFGEYVSGDGRVMNHDGIDLVADKGTPVLAAADGSVRESGYEPRHGNYVIIDHEGGYSTVYGCLQEILTEAGAEVKAGDQIGTVGSTGLSTGPHLHFELRSDGEAVDPSQFWE